MTIPYVKLCHTTMQRTMPDLCNVRELRELLRITYKAKGWRASGSDADTRCCKCEEQQSKLLRYREAAKHEAHIITKSLMRHKSPGYSDTKLSTVTTA